MAADRPAADRDGKRVPVRRLTVLHDAGCSLCGFLRDWLGRQPQLVPLEFVAAGSAEAAARFPGLDHRATLDEITVVGDLGQVYQGAAAWIVTLWALREYRPMSHRLSTPAGAKLARGAVLAAARWRDGRGQSAGQSAGWGGGVYRRGDGWAYDPQAGWHYNPPTCADGACFTG
ncbi:DCC1-like thiol-disulfide oxidoreductase family protein [Streptomyces sp. NPDC102259]|uniref:DCC1-like thiol-disulfide oxidoreductase family protein n=1 Tax=Streptomyces sp. NPDC102259 TaxID=3366148 RepID=UPI00382BE469